MFIHSSSSPLHLFVKKWPPIQQPPRVDFRGVVIYWRPVIMVDDPTLKGQHLVNDLGKIYFMQRRYLARSNFLPVFALKVLP